jgi:polyisoprenoid-binding protein YceI
MKKVSILMTALMITAASYAQTWTSDKAHSKVGFSITHMQVNDIEGMFKSFDATITSGKADFSDAVFTATAQIASVFTDDVKRDGHLQSPDFFDARQYPTATFKSKSVTVTGDHKLTIKGDLTMHGETKTIVLEATFKGPAENPMSKKQVAGFKITGKIKRTDFKIGTTMPETVLSDEVLITANCEFQKS